MAPLIDIGQDSRPKLIPCTCGKDNRNYLFLSRQMSPDAFDLRVGTIELVVLEVVLVGSTFAVGTPELWPYLASPLPAIFLLLTLYRLTKGHNLSCSLKWAWYFFCRCYRKVRYDLSWTQH
jgi:hypothetical protein